LVEKLPPTRHIAGISCAGNTTFVIMDAAECADVYAWGEGAYGSLGVGKV
jgi:alpha-tubulin suppressor-like RCC1 family protein